ncbi:flagellar assembly protein FliW [Arthrobacter bambusae]|uniref:flagellar assembly protein FliW n=1 Tax=Arthrobacter bambusae TaxID=1338426 RepID=UPI00278AF869|nr:flagellar assembly protein FliW [Arthrobacter bambusae]MDQ0029418.1 flagellar assembly factor FliW [Arthrobacter bambusae]MDQ0097078.1 flagellar assembly factor FliW [Arthrobacter bambusae]
MSPAQASRELSFTAPMPGLEAAEGFALRGIDGAPGLYAMESASPRIRMFLADASVYVPDYAPAIPDSTLEDLGLQGTQPATTLVVVNPTLEKTTVNLAAPIVLNPDTGRCTQLLLDSKEYPLRAELSA